MHRFKAQEISCDAFVPYGWLVDTPDHAGAAIRGGSSQRIDGLTELAFDAEGGKPCVALFKAKARDPAEPWTELERHCLGYANDYSAERCEVRGAGAQCCCGGLRAGSVG